MISTTRLRYISARKREEIISGVEALGFKVEIKSITWDGKNYTIWFVLPETEGIRFTSVEGSK